ncbi:nitrogen fixation protein NifB [Teredinibacter sp. KSP-S5-2]|uniref:nitrogen fixation protein NifB n=1 Tax=Teredinibacter sp. KSP-S5-2 TaxID=3034506 RepID=UPI002934153B|nr:nitrogen fixation protein NifB [Teredinibacter sp. KSP-S5-2]WNO09851.1 nitrogen fixation protein NifB [Teredinibacter sp. KSP-S5-2]
MPKPRKELIALDATPYYHCTTRCVRRAFLCGKDSVTGQCFEHRRKWIEDRILQLSKVFCIDVCAYAVMSNHYHVVLHVNQKKAHHLDDLKVVLFWHQLFNGTERTKQFAKGEFLEIAKLTAVHQKIERWRKRLADISWFMRCISEPLARLNIDSRQ